MLKSQPSAGGGKQHIDSFCSQAKAFVIWLTKNQPCSRFPAQETHGRRLQRGCGYGSSCAGVTDVPSCSQIAVGSFRRQTKVVTFPGGCEGPAQPTKPLDTSQVFFLSLGCCGQFTRGYFCIPSLCFIPLDFEGNLCCDQTLGRFTTYYGRNVLFQAIHPSFLFFQK